MSHEFSGFTVNGIRKAVDTLGYTSTLLPALSQTARDTLTQSSLFKFHPGAAMDEVLVQLSTLHGVDAAAAVMEEATRSSIQGVVAPLARMYLTLKGNEPSVLFERFNDLTRSTSRGITATWDGAHGRLSLTYTSRVNPLVVHGWRGAVRFILKFCQRDGVVTVEAPSADGCTVSLLVVVE